MKVGVIAPLVFGTSGFARAGRQIMFGLNDLGVEIQLYGINKPSNDSIITKEEFDKLCSFISPKGSPDIWFNLAPQCYFSFSNQHKGWKIGMSMFETYDNPPSFINRCQSCDEIWVPSVFCFDTFHRSSLVSKERLAYMPLGVDTDLYSPRLSKLRMTDPFKTDFDYIYGIVCGYSARKGVDLVLTAHHELFDTKDGVALFVKGDSYGSRLFPKDIESLYKGTLLIRTDDPDLIKTVNQKLLIHKPIVLYSFEGYSDIQLAEIYLTLDGFVFPSRGEGFGLPPLEAMSCEVPVVGTKATGMEEYMLEDISYPVKSNGWKPEPRCDWIATDYKGSLFADPDYVSYREAVWNMYSNREEAKLKAVRARQFVIDNYSIPVITLRMKSRLQAILEGKTTTEDFWPMEFS